MNDSVSASAPHRRWLSIAWVGGKVLLSLFLYGVASYHTFVQWAIATARPGISWTVGPIILVIIPQAVLHSLLVLGRSREYSLVRRVVGSLGAAVVTASLLFGLALVVGVLPSALAGIVSVASMVAWFTLPILTTLLADHLLDPARQWRQK